MVFVVDVVVLEFDCLFDFVLTCSLILVALLLIACWLRFLLDFGYVV